MSSSFEVSAGVSKPLRASDLAHLEMPETRFVELSSSEAEEQRNFSDPRLPKIRLVEVSPRKIDLFAQALEFELPGNARLLALRGEPEFLTEKSINSVRTLGQLASPPPRGTVRSIPRLKKKLFEQFSTEEQETFPDLPPPVTNIPNTSTTLNPSINTPSINAPFKPSLPTPRSHKTTLPPLQKTTHRTPAATSKQPASQVTPRRPARPPGGLAMGHTASSAQKARPRAIPAAARPPAPARRPTSQAPLIEAKKQRPPAEAKRRAVERRLSFLEDIEEPRRTESLPAKRRTFLLVPVPMAPPTMRSVEKEVEQMDLNTTRFSLHDKKPSASGRLLNILERPNSTDLNAASRRPETRRASKKKVASCSNASVNKQFAQIWVAFCVLVVAVVFALFPGK